MYSDWFSLTRYTCYDNPPNVGGLANFEVGIDIPGYLGPLSPRHLLSLTLTVKHNDAEPRGRGLPASAATLSRE